MKYHRNPTEFERVTILLPIAESRILKHFAVDAGRSVSMVAREAVREYLRQKTGEIRDEVDRFAAQRAKKDALRDLRSERNR